MKFKGSYYILLHPRPDVDCFFSVALLKKFGGIKVKGYLFGRKKRKSKNIIGVDTGGDFFDHHGLSGITSTDLVARALKLENEKWIQKILKFVKRVDLEGRSLPFDIANIQKAMMRDPSFLDEEIAKIGIKMAENIIDFSKENLKRENSFGRKIIKEFLEEKNKKPELFNAYFNQLSREKFERPADFVEVLTAERKLKGEVKAKKLGKLLLEILFKDWENYQDALKEVKRARKIQVKSYLIILGESDNPKFSVAARVKGGHIIIQKNKRGNVQIFFEKKLIDKKIADEIVANLRELEMRLSKRPIPSKDYLIKEGKLENWFYFVGEEKQKGERGLFIFNGSFTDPSVPPTKIPIQKIIEIIKRVFHT